MDNIRMEELNELYGYGTAILKLLNDEFEERERKIKEMTEAQVKADQLKDNIRKIVELRKNVEEMLEQ